MSSATWGYVGVGPNASLLSRAAVLSKFNQLIALVLTP